MPRYFFRLTKGDQSLNNHKGIELAGNAAARTDAIALARDLKNEKKMPGWNWTGWFVVVLDEHGRRIEEFSIEDA